MPVYPLRAGFDAARRLFSLAPEGGTALLVWGPAVEVDRQTLHLDDADSVQCEGLQPDGALLPGAQASVAARFEATGIELRLRLALSEQGTTAVLAATLRNTGTATRRLGKCALVHVGAGRGEVVLGAATPDLVYLDVTGDQRLNQVRLLVGGVEASTKHIAHLHDRSSKQTLHLGFTTFDRIDTEHAFAAAADGHVQVLASYCNFQGFELAPGASVATETLAIEFATDPHASLERWADRVQAHYRPAIPERAPAGWVGWAWVDSFTVENYESVVLRNARALGERLKGRDLDYIWVSIGNIGKGLPGNWLQWNHDSFPSGVASLVEGLRELGLKLGLWIAPFWGCSHAHEQMAELGECLLRDEQGDLLVTRDEWQYGDSGRLPKGERPVCYALDGSHPRTGEFLRRVFATYREWGVRYYMVDFLHGGSGVGPGGFPYGDYHDPSMVKGPEVYRNALETVRQAAGDDTYLLASSGPTVLNTGLVDAARVGNDYGEGRALYPESYFYPATFVVNGPGFWTSHKYASTNMAGTYFTHRKLYLNDSGNVMTVDKPIPLCEAQIAATLFGINGGPMMLGDDVDRMSEERLALVRKCLPRGEEGPFPVDLFDAPAPDYPRVFHLPVATAWDRWDLVGVFNYDDEPYTSVLNLGRLGLAPDRPYQVWEFWNEQYLGAQTGGLRVCVPPRSARLYRLQRRRSHPWLLSTDMHVRQGQFEVLSCEWDPGTLTLRGCATRPAGESGSLYVTVPAGMRLADPQGLWIARDVNDSTLIVRKPLRFGEAPAEWGMRFAPIQEGEWVTETAGP